MIKLEPKKLFGKPNSKILAFAPLEPFSANPIVREWAGINGANLVYRPKINPHHLLDEESQKWQFYECIKEYNKLKQDLQDKFQQPFFDGFQMLARPDDPIKKVTQFLNKNRKEIGIDFIDLNFSCPGHKVLPHNRGGELLKPSKNYMMGEVIEKVLKFTSLPVSVKIRRGFTIQDDPRELAKILKDYDIAWISINRAPVKMQNVSPKELIQDFSSFIEFSDELNGKIPVLLNGAFSRPEQKKELKSIPNVDGIMIGRAALGNPLIFNNFKENHEIYGDKEKKDEVKIIFDQLYDLIKKYTGPDTGRWITISNLKLIFFHILKNYLTFQDLQLPLGFGWANWKKKKFSYEELIKIMQSSFNFIDFSKWANLFN